MKKKMKILDYINLEGDKPLPLADQKTEQIIAVLYVVTAIFILATAWLIIYYML